MLSANFIKDEETLNNLKSFTVPPFFPTTKRQHCTVKFDFSV